jgi:hypothetical protein
MSLASLRRHLEQYRQPAYTGENRCWPCTVLNVAIVAVVGVALSRRDRLAGGLAVAAGCLLVWLRGYVVPGTPRFAPSLVEPLPIDFGHAPDGVGSESLADDPDPEAMIRALAEAGVIVADDEALSLEESFRAAWEDRMAALRELPGDELASRAAAASHQPVEGAYHGERVLLAGDRDVWLSPAVAVAETAAVEALADRDVPADLRAQAAAPLRTFVRTCPTCGGPVAETTLRNCCGGPGSVQRHPELPVLACEDCDAVVFEFDETPTREA